MCKMSECGSEVLPVGSVAVIFVSLRSEQDEAGYQAAGALMEALAVEQPGYLGHVGVRQSDGLGITVSYWADEQAARAWRGQADHAGARALGRERWYSSFTLVIAEVSRSYAWSSDTAG
jgi:heme-degrading monooxygenase HmoA